MKNVTKEYKNSDEIDTTAIITTSPLDASQNRSNPSERINSLNGQTFVLEYLAPRRSCRVNVVITAFANGKFHLHVELKKLYTHIYPVLSYNLLRLLPIFMSYFRG